MSQGRVSASAAIVFLALFVFLFSFQIHAATYTVGGLGGWTFNTLNWPNGKRFKAGDVLVFKYDASFHNVVAVDKGSYNACKTPAGAKIFISGNDRIRLAKGQNYFICNFVGHCQSGMKIAITAT